MEETIYLNGSLVPRSEARISVFDHGFLYGYGLFETMRAYNGKIFLLERHIKRLLGSAVTIGLGDSLAGIDLNKACLDTLKANKLEDARLRLTVTGGESDSFPWEGKAGQPTVVVTARPYSGFSPEKYEQGFKVYLAPVRRCAQSSISGIKSVSYLLSVLARNEAAAQGLDEALLLNDDGYIAEGGSCNVFFVKGSRLVTPSLGSGILPGITRDVVIELADELGIIITEGTVGLAVIKQCDEAFLTNAVMEVMPMTAASDSAGNTVTISGGKPGEITRKLMAAYKEKVAKETAT
ncbi:MAG: aminotransferase class IV [Dehalococcoidales bacterium]|nr:aminotransferase class IV [Dehalococcoidales bacterium]